MQGVSENSQEYASSFTNMVDALRETGERTSVLALHHSGKDGTMRGSTVFSGDADVVMEAIRDEKTVCLANRKMKDARPCEDILYGLEPVEADDNGTLVAVRRTTFTPVEKDQDKSEIRARRDLIMTRDIIEKAAVQALDSVKKVRTISGLAIEVAHSLEDVSERTARRYLKGLAVDNDNLLHGRFNPANGKFS